MQHDTTTSRLTIYQSTRRCVPEYSQLQTVNCRQYYSLVIVLLLYCVFAHSIACGRPTLDQSATVIHEQKALVYL
jgi:hypothetical protein